MRHIPMSMVDWIKKLDGFLTLNDREILNHAGKVSHQVAKQIAEQAYDELNQIRIKQNDKQDGDFELSIEEIVTGKATNK